MGRLSSSGIAPHCNTHNPLCDVHLSYHLSGVIPNVFVTGLLLASILTPSLPQPVTFPGWKMHGPACKQNISRPLVLATTQFWKHFSGGMPSVLVDNKTLCSVCGQLPVVSLPPPHPPGLPTATDTTSSVTYISRSISVA